MNACDDIVSHINIESEDYLSFAIIANIISPLLSVLPHFIWLWFHTID